MKKNILIILQFCLFFCFISCNKESYKDLYWGASKASKNNVIWEALPNAHNTKFGLTFSFDIYDSKSEVVRQTLNLYKVPLKIDKYILKKTDNQVDDGKVGALFTTLTSEGDVYEDFYYIKDIDSTFNHISITKIKGDEIWGTFNLKVHRDASRPLTSKDIPEVITFENGDFHTKIIEK